MGRSLRRLGDGLSAGRWSLQGLLNLDAQSWAYGRGQGPKGGLADG